MLNPATGKSAWHLPGVAEVEWADPERVVLFRMSAHPSVEAHDLATGKEIWTFPVESALGTGADLSGGWAFGSAGDALIGYLAPYQKRTNGPLSAFGFFSLRLSDGKQQWARKRLLRVYPSANPAVSLITREVDGADRYGGFTALDPHTGRSVSPAHHHRHPRGQLVAGLPAGPVRGRLPGARPAGQRCTTCAPAMRSAGTRAPGPSARRRPLR